MAYAASVIAKRDISVSQPSSRNRNRQSFWRRVMDAIADARMRQADRQITAYLAGADRLSDQAEREIERRFLSNPIR